MLLVVQKEFSAGPDDIMIPLSHEGQVGGDLRRDIVHTNQIDPLLYLRAIGVSSIKIDTLLLLFVTRSELTGRARDLNDSEAEFCNSFTVAIDASHMIACSSGLISLSSSIAAALGDSDSKATIASWFSSFLCWGVDGVISSAKRVADVSHKKCNGVLPSLSCASQAAG